MIHQGQDPNASDYDGRTALMLACMKGHKQLVQVRYSSDYRPVFLHPWSFAQHRACRLLCFPHMEAVQKDASNDHTVLGKGGIAV